MYNIISTDASLFCVYTLLFCKKLPTILTLDLLIGHFMAGLRVVCDVIIHFTTSILRYIFNLVSAHIRDTLYNWFICCIMYVSIIRLYRFFVFMYYLKTNILFPQVNWSHYCNQWRF